MDAAVKRRALYKVPAITFATNLDDGHAFAGLSLVYVFSAGGQAAVRIKVAIVGVFVVDRHQGAVRVIRERKQAHAVIVVAELHFLSVGAAITAWIKRRAVCSEWLAPTDQYR